MFGHPKKKKKEKPIPLVQETSIVVNKKIIQPAITNSTTSILITCMFVFMFQGLTLNYKQVPKIKI